MLYRAHLEDAMTAIRIKIRVDSETLHLPELRPMIGREVEIIVLDECAQPQALAPASSKPIWEEFEEITSGLSEEALRQAPTDGAEQHDHYLYGSPKRKQ
jgi:hypothetical protein